MNFAEFAGNHPWALVILKSDLLLRMVELLEEGKAVEELVEELKPLKREDIERALRALEAHGVVRAEGSRWTLTDLGKKFMEVYRQTF